MASRNLKDLHPDIQPLARYFLGLLKFEGLDILVTCTYRSNAEQNDLYEVGRSLPGAIVTNAKGGQSEHNFTVNGQPASKAFDIVPVICKECIWDTNHKSWKIIERVWNTGVSNDRFYLDWYGRPDAPFREYPHFCLKVIK